MRKITFLIILSLLSLPLLADNSSSYDEIFEELSNTPVSQLDFRIQKLNLLLNDKIKGLRVNQSFYFNNSDDNFHFGYSFSKYYVESVICYKDQINPRLIVCEVSTSHDFNKISIRKRVEKTKNIYVKILEFAKSTLHPSFDESHLKIILKSENLGRKYLTSDEIKQIQEEYPEFTFTNGFQEIQEEKVLMIWENGVPHYQDAFFI